jgi:hypothetical protein
MNRQEKYRHRQTLNGLRQLNLWVQAELYDEARALLVDYLARAESRHGIDDLSARYCSLGETEKTFPGNYCGWTTQRGKDGYIRLHRKVQGKVKSIYIGRVWDEAKADERIAMANKAFAVDVLS